MIVISRLNYDSSIYDESAVKILALYINVLYLKQIIRSTKSRIEIIIGLNFELGIINSRLSSIYLDLITWNRYYCIEWLFQLREKCIINETSVQCAFSYDICLSHLSVGWGTESITFFSVLSYNKDGITKVKEHPKFGNNNKVTSQLEETQR